MCYVHCREYLCVCVFFLLNHSLACTQCLHNYFRFKFQYPTSKSTRTQGTSATNGYGERNHGYMHNGKTEVIDKIN
uniref:Putative secreted protein n=1 Tax=Anopheles marajoara TaxID=58244 RepID=A0A2M4CCX9_9DIPT